MQRQLRTVEGGGTPGLGDCWTRMGFGVGYQSRQAGKRGMLVRGRGLAGTYWPR